jgi:hypothetical protein
MCFGVQVWGTHWPLHTPGSSSHDIVSFDTIGSMYHLSLGVWKKHCLFVCFICLFCLFLCNNIFFKKKNCYVVVKHELLYNYGLHFTGLFDILNTSYQYD